MSNSEARKVFLENKVDIDTLWSIHTAFTGAGVGRKDAKAEVLNRSAMIFITACWESYIEDVAAESFDFLLNNCADHSKIPIKVRNHATTAIRKDPDITKIWAIADVGWKNVLLSHKQLTLENWLSTFNTPKTGQTNDLFETLLGLKRLSSNWYWQKMSRTQAAEKLDDFITIRGNIAHRTKHGKRIAKDLSAKYINHVEHLVGLTDEALRKHLLELTSVSPW